ncbi:hypothetical protein [Flavobacterium sp.]|uniref:hypothetical protein n=1 Tax=Flavobacterium sp. TaxID=239 RepID=UPI002488E21E|nr:hypothetical protein [Flavobacterium sp.]MDI1316881.1 hypothetical protein [Flavobacterium sp.]
MKKIILLLTLMNCIVCFSQNFETFYSKNYNSNSCSEEKLSFNFRDDFVIRTDSYYDSSEKLPSRRVDSGFDDKGFFYENFTPTFYLNKYGVIQYERIRAFTFRILYDKKGGNILYVLEIDNKMGLKNGKFHFTQLGYETLCK